MFNNQLFMFSRESETKRKVLITLHQERPLVLFSRVQNYGEKPSRRSLFINTYSYERGRYMHLSHNQFVIHLKKKFTKSYQQGGDKPPFSRRLKYVVRFSVRFKKMNVGV